MTHSKPNIGIAPPDGEIVFPAGILQVPMYSPSWPAHLKYGAFGSIAAHELTHAFDNSGSQYDEKGQWFLLILPFNLTQARYRSTKGLVDKFHGQGIRRTRSMHRQAV